MSYEPVIFALTTQGPQPLGSGERVTPARRGEREWQRGRRQRPPEEERPPAERAPAAPGPEETEGGPRPLDILA